MPARAERDRTVRVGSHELRVRVQEPLARYTTFRIGGPADYLVRASDRPTLELALEWAEQERLPVTVIGGGSNLLVRDGGIRGLVIVFRAAGEALDGAIQLAADDGATMLTLPATAPLSWVGHRTSELGLAGLEWAAGLPGVVGGAVVNNAGAHGGAIGDVLADVELYDLVDRRVLHWTRDALAPRYRMTELKAQPRPRRYVVLGARVRLVPGDPARLLRTAEENARWRRQHQPTGPCAGSVFTNPPGTYAGYLIEQAGLKGFQIGRIRVSERHANFFLNLGSATAAEALALLEAVQRAVAEQFGIVLQPEIEIVGEP
ncbi:UDP-N-acetylmuramate dehydrogenase [Thermomicrobium sp. 4228-Ro]|uniref:UDP-N-acetylmuramate dehydrogenase n=1 Tax=Thermomicrobium sp. 4228-Ro TaxID=2993937 RepID=UPI002248840C|nr:UDP-N-acetylmuramate dehydrogenase [Thermomicrobium sp. 4228-Ro]MCX2727295.1 UDP-N-acetylmuramate dehydrogenase [Thermomicrobium sp. 4228-Ro]